MNKGPHRGRRNKRRLPTADIDMVMEWGPCMSRSSILRLLRRYNLPGRFNAVDLLLVAGRLDGVMADHLSWAAHHLLPLEMIRKVSAHHWWAHTAWGNWLYEESRLSPEGDPAAHDRILLSLLTHYQGYKLNTYVIQRLRKGES